MRGKLFRVFKDLCLIVLMGFMYMGIEVLWRGRTSIFMGLVGGTCGLLIGELNEHSAFYVRKMWEQSLIGTLITLAIEFISGVILNIWWKLDIWDYSGMYGNILGQICIPYAFLWFLLMPTAVFVDDWLRYKLFKEEKPSGLISNYISLFTLK